jgi:HEAT repeat protein
VDPDAGLRLCAAAVREADGAVLAAALRLFQQRPAPVELAPDLVRLLGHEDFKVTHGAGEALEQLGLPAVPALLDAVRRADEKRRQGALHVLLLMERYAGAAGEPVRERLRPEAPLLRRVARRADGALGNALDILGDLAAVDPKTRRLAADLLRAEDAWADPPVENVEPVSPEVRQGDIRRRCLIEYLGERGVPDEQTVALIGERARRDASRWVRDAAVRALSQLVEAHPAALDLLLDVFDQHRLAYHTCEAAMRVGWLKEKAVPALPRLMEMARGPDLARQLSALEALRHMGASAAPAAAAVLAAAGAPRQEVRQRAVETLGEMGPKVEGILDALVRSTADRDQEVARTALRRLAEFGGKEPGVLAALTAALDSPSEWVQDAALTQLCSLRPPTGEALAVLLELLRHEREYVRFRAAEGLRHFDAGAPDLLPALESLLHDAHSWVRETAAETLGRLRPRRGEAVVLLRRYLKDAVLEVQRKAAMSLGWIGGLSRPALPALRKLAAKHPRDTAFRKAVERIEKARP